MPALFEPLTLRQLTLPNRIMVSPMCMYSAVDGDAQPWHHAHLGALALSGAGLLCIEATAVSAEGRITPGDLGLYSEANEAALSSLMQMLRAVSPVKLAIQLAHAGRKASSRAPWESGPQWRPHEGGWVPEAASEVLFKPGDSPPRALTHDDLTRLRAAFAQAATRSARLGFDAVEVHMAHGYLLHQFLSPIANARNDEYGGSLPNRMRFPLEVFEAVRAAFPAHLPVGVRVSATDWLEHTDTPGWTLPQTIELAQQLKQRGCDWIDVSSGGISLQQKIAAGPGYQVPLAQSIRAATGLPTIAVGLITEPQQAEAIIADGQADLVALARAFLYDPRWGWHAAAALDGRVHGPVQYLRALPADTAPIFQR
jgi:2,4-dienoyl-CoA reductase-like NADH-dependent reductase (Old Yellow Enzyme family)